MMRTPGAAMGSLCCSTATASPSPPSTPSFVPPAAGKPNQLRDATKMKVDPGMMKLLSLITICLTLAATAFALDGQVQIHDPSTIVRCGGKFYTYGTGGTCLVSDDGWTWHRGITPPRRGMAPDIIQLGDRYCMYVARNVGAQPSAEINLVWTRSLDTNSADYKWVEEGVVVSSDGVEDCNAIDPGLLLDRND